MVDLLEERIIQWFHPLDLEQIEEVMKLLGPEVDKITEEGWGELVEAHNLLQKTKELAETEYEKLWSMPEIKTCAKYRNLLMLQKENFVDYINRVSKGLEDWQRQENRDYTFTEIGFESEKRNLEKESRETSGKTLALLNYAKHLFENFKAMRFGIYDVLKEVEEMEKDIKDTELYRMKLQDRILRELHREWLRVVGEGGIPEFDYRESAKKWDVPKEIMMRVIEETIDEGWLEHSTFGHVGLTPEGRKECKRRGFDKKG